MSVTRRGGDFLWARCDGCQGEHVKLLRWTPGQLLQDREHANELAAKLPGWHARQSIHLHLGPQCVKQGQSLQAQLSA